MYQNFLEEHLKRALESNMNKNLQKKKLVIIGNGLATMQLLKELGHQQRYRITVLSAERVAHYNRIMLSSLLAQETDLNSITPCDHNWYKERHINVLLNHSVHQVDLENRVIQCVNGAQFNYDYLVFATGSRAFIPTMPGTGDYQKPDQKILEGVIGFRELIDVELMKKVSHQYQKAVVVGAGLLGIEAAVGLAKQGMNVTLIHRRDVLLNRQIDKNASALLINELRKRGITIITGHSPVALCGSPSSLTKNSNQVTEIELENGTRIGADLVVFATGIIPNTALAQASGLATKQGICINEQLQTSQSNIYALGECCEFNGNTYGLVAPIWNQARILAKQLLLSSDTPFSQRPRYIEESFATQLKVSGIDVHSMGIINASDTEQDCDELQFNDPARAIYKKILLHNHKIIGAVLYGDVSDSLWYFNLMQQQLSTESFRQNLIFGQALCTE